MRSSKSYSLLDISARVLLRSASLIRLYELLEHVAGVELTNRILNCSGSRWAVLVRDFFWGRSGCGCSLSGEQHYRPENVCSAGLHVASLNMCLNSQLSETIVNCLRKMRCPHPLQAHQIQVCESLQIPTPHHP
jgi:hypothetical protein